MDMSRNPFHASAAALAYARCLQQARTGDAALCEGGVDAAVLSLAAAADSYCLVTGAEGVYAQVT